MSDSWGLSKQASLSSFCRPEERTQQLWSTFLLRTHSAAGWYVHLSACYSGSLLCSTVYVHGCFLAFPDPGWMTQCGDIKDRLAKWSMLALPLPRASVFILLWPFPLATCRYVVVGFFLVFAGRVQIWFCGLSFLFVFIISPMSPLSPQFSSVQWLSRVRVFATPWIAACQASLSIT